MTRLLYVKASLLESSPRVKPKKVEKTLPLLAARALLDARADPTTEAL